MYKSIDLKDSDNEDTFRSVIDIMDVREKRAAMYKMRKYRASLSKDDREQVKAYDRDRKALQAADMTEEERAEKREKERIQKAAYRKLQREKAGKEEKIYRKWTLEELEYDRLKCVIRMREARQSRTKEEHSNDKEKAKQGMRDRKSEYLQDERSKTKFMSVERLWRNFWDSSSDAKDLMKAKEPEIAERLEKEDNDNPEIASRLAEEDIAKEAMRKKLNAEKIKAWRKKKRLELQKALDEPIILPEMEKSEYERIRDENVKQLEEARKEFFKQL